MRSGVLRLLQLPFPSARRIWQFTTESHVHAGLNNHTTGKDFTAILLGNPSGNRPGGGDASMASIPSTLNAVGGSTTVALLPGPRSNGNDWKLRVLMRAVVAVVRGIDLDIALDPAARVTPIAHGSLAKALLVLVGNTNTAGHLRLAAAGAVPKSGIGVLIEATLVSFSYPVKLEDSGSLWI